MGGKKRSHLYRQIWKTEIRLFIGFVPGILPMKGPPIGPGTFCLDPYLAVTARREGVQLAHYLMIGVFGYVLLAM